MDRGSPKALKVFNQKEICHCIMHNGPMTRAQIANELSLSKPTTSLNVQDLLNKHILSETTQAISSVGKKGILLDFNINYYFILIVDTTSLSLQDKMILHVCNLKGEVILEDIIMMEPRYSSTQKKEIFRIYNQKVNEWIDCFKHPTGKIYHVVLSLPGVFNKEYEEGISFLQSQLTYSISNNINLALLGEKIIDNNSQRNIAYLKISQGLGAAFCINNQLYTGRECSAGEIGYYEVIIENKNIPLKDIISIDAILKEKAELNYIFNKTLSPFDDLLLGIKNQNQWCIDKLSFIYIYIENLVMNLVVTLNLDEVIIAGAILELIPDLTKQLQSKVDSYPLSKTLIKSASHAQTTDIGGYYLAMKSILDHILL